MIKYSNLTYENFIRPYTLSELEFNIIENGPNVGKVNDHNICEDHFSYEHPNRHNDCIKFKETLAQHYEQNGFK